MTAWVSRMPRARAMLPFAMYPLLAAADLSCIHAELKCVQLKTINKVRAGSERRSSRGLAGLRFLHKQHARWSGGAAGTAGCEFRVRFLEAWTAAVCMTAPAVPICAVAVYSHSVGSPQAPPERSPPAFSCLWCRWENRSLNCSTILIGMPLSMSLAGCR